MVTVPEKQLQQLTRVFLEENKKLNLSAFRTEEHCWIGNVLDSIALLDAFRTLGFRITGMNSRCLRVQIGSNRAPRHAEAPQGEGGFESTLIDLGTGGGFPLLPLAIAAPEVRCIGIDSVAKKIDAIRRIAVAMRFPNVELACERIEELAHQEKFRASADLVTVRAVAPLPVLLEYALPLLKIGGLCAFWKSTRIADELGSSANAQKLLHAAFAGTYEYELPGNFGKRLIIFFKKNAATPSEYPRKVGVPKAKPL